MLKKDLVNELHSRFPGYLKEDIAAVVDIILEGMASALEHGRRIEIRGFGSFALHDQKARKFVNPKTGKLTECPANKRIVFRAGKNLRKLPPDTGC